MRRGDLITWDDHGSSLIPPNLGILLDDPAPYKDGSISRILTSSGEITVIYVSRRQLYQGAPRVLSESPGGV